MYPYYVDNQFKCKSISFEINTEFLHWATHYLLPHDVEILRFFRIGKGVRTLIG